MTPSLISRAADSLVPPVRKDFAEKPPASATDRMSGLALASATIMPFTMVVTRPFGMHLSCTPYFRMVGNSGGHTSQG